MLKTWVYHFSLKNPIKVTVKREKRDFYTTNEIKKKTIKARYFKTVNRGQLGKPEQLRHKAAGTWGRTLVRNGNICPSFLWPGKLTTITGLPFSTLVCRKFNSHKFIHGKTKISYKQTSKRTLKKFFWETSNGRLGKCDSRAKPSSFWYCCIPGK